ncbi:hypothetical protein [Salinicoccus sp. YB14-2]|uniref:hypothetical protein n=1 Tax=Salinicoccus sp. YB14-2 TaxID=1572701 RepID=UPI00068BCA5E|nr:hypothetical protein [Salinicoccus sp. YB14-2]
MKITLQENITGYLQEHNIIQNYPSSDYGVVCEAESNIVAYLYYSKNLYHPSAVYLHFAILDKGVESETLIKMYDKFNKVLPSSNIILQVHRNFDLYRGIIESNGFSEFRKTYELEMDIQKMIAGFSNNNLDEKYTIKNFNMTDGLQKITKLVYQSNHEINPLQDMELSEWKDLITDDLDFESSIVICDLQDDIVAYLMMYENEDAYKDVGYCYFKDQEAKNSLSAEFYNILLKLEEAQFTHINLEIDSTDKYLYELFRDFLEDETPSLVSYINQNNH